jgi:hypothetical protein
MDSASSLPYPTSRALAGWWRQLQPHRPTALWVGWLFVHRVEALTECAEPRPIDPLSLHVLDALAVSDRREESIHGQGADTLPGGLHLPRGALLQLLAGLQKRQLVRRCPAGCWSLTEHGREVLLARVDTTSQRQRRVFVFVERLNPAGRRLAPPHFLSLADCDAPSWQVDEGHQFDVALLQACVDQSAAWKECHAFPGSVRRVVPPQAADTPDAWEQIVIDRPQRMPVVLAGAGGGGSLAGFAIQPESWTLHTEMLVLRLNAEAREVLPDLVVPVSTWEEAWRLWCRQRHLPLSEAEACQLRFDGIHVDVHAPNALVQRLRTARSDLLHEESALLAGDGYLRAAALLRLRAR